MARPFPTAHPQAIAQGPSQAAPKVLKVRIARKGRSLHLKQNTPDRSDGLQNPKADVQRARNVV